MRLKVCGMKYQDNIAEVSNLQPDYLGFIFYKDSPRFIEDVVCKVPNNIKKVGVFVNASLDYIKAQVLKHQLKLVQLHGDESVSYCRDLSGLFTPKKAPKIIKAFLVDEHFDFKELLAYEEVCDYYLFDTKAHVLGGTGKVFSWELLDQYPSDKLFFLSGGIGIDQLEKVREFLQKKVSKYCFALDVNSKFEKKPGLKNIEKLKEFKSQL